MPCVCVCVCAVFEMQSSQMDFVYHIMKLTGIMRQKCYDCLMMLLSLMYYPEEDV